MFLIKTTVQFALAIIHQSADGETLISDACHAILNLVKDAFRLASDDKNPPLVWTIRGGFCMQQNYMLTGCHVTVSRADPAI